MPIRPQPRPRSLAPVLGLTLALAACLGLIPAVSRAGEAKHSTTTWSSSSSGRRTETRRETPRGYSYSSETTSDDDDADGPAEVDAWTFSRNEGHWRDTNGSERDWQDAQDAIDHIDGDVLWFRRGTDRYVVTDAAALHQVAEIFAPQEELGHRQGELGARQGELGRLQGDLGRKQGELGRIQAQISRVQAVVALQRARRGDGADDVDGDRAEMERQQREASELQAELGAQQSLLGERQSALGAQQAELGREQTRVAKEVAAALGKLTRELVDDGRAKRAPR